MWMSGVTLATRFCSNVKHNLGAGKGLQFVKIVVEFMLGNSGSGASAQFITLKAEKKAIEMQVTQDSGKE